MLAVPDRPSSRAGSHAGSSTGGGAGRPMSMYDTASVSSSAGLNSPMTPAANVAALGPTSFGAAQGLSGEHLQPGHSASLVDFSQTLAMYRENAKKSGSPDLLLEFARFLLQTAVPQFPERAGEFKAEAFKMCKKAAASGNVEAQFHLAECYETGVCSEKGKPDYAKALNMYMQATKHGHGESAYRVAVYHENGRGTSKSPPRALQFYQKAGALGHPGACFRLGMAELHGELGLAVNPRNGVKWLKHAAASATPDHCEGLYELALLHETGIDHVVFVDYEYSVKLLREAAQLGHVTSMYRLGSYYEHGNHVAKSGATSFGYFKAAAERGHPDSMFGVASWYLTGNREASVPQSDELAFEWMKKAAEAGLIKAFFALGYLYEEGIGVPAEDFQQAKLWYERALAKGDKRAAPKLAAIKAHEAREAAGEMSASERRSRARAKKRGATGNAAGQRTGKSAPPAGVAPEGKNGRTAEEERERIRKARTGEDACTIM
ncbi:Chitin synthase 4 [Blastocladiella emersonii ATCC 22665]|nr:Chitin synthase 4 [Blastocladiella emersonii ATCC 22665]